MITWIKNIILAEWYLFGFKSIIEIGFFSVIFYYVFLWLKQDKQKPLLPVFFGYCLIIGISSYAQLTAFNALLLQLMPVTLVLFVLMHQETIQKNGIRLCNITPAKPVEQEWTAEIVRNCMNALNNNQSMQWVIEKSDSLTTLVSTSLKLNAPLCPELITLINSSTLTNPAHFFWANRQGILLGINTVVINSEHDWHADALLLSAKTDCFILKTNPITRSFTLIARAKLLELNNAADTLAALHNYLEIPVKQSDQKGSWHELRQPYSSHQSTP